MRYELEPQYSRRKSFYGRAKVRTEGDKIILRSYSTDVAYIKEGRPVVSRSYSKTTSSHVKEFLLQQGFKADNMTQILKDYAPTDQDKAEAKEEAPEDETGLGGMMKCLSMISAVGRITTKDIKEQNEWDLRMVKASGLPLDFPADFDSLPEEEKRRRLDGIMEIMAETGKKAVA
jgi:hypothetical protein